MGDPATRRTPYPATSQFTWVQRRHRLFQWNSVGAERQLRLERASTTAPGQPNYPVRSVSDYCPQLIVNRLRCKGIQRSGARAVAFRAVGSGEKAKADRQHRDACAINNDVKEKSFSRGPAIRQAFRRLMSGEDGRGPGRSDYNRADTRRHEHLRNGFWPCFL